VRFLIPGSTVRWIFVRHGITEANRDGWLSGWIDLPLLPEGQREAATAGAALANERIDRVLTSDLVRAFQTALGLLVASGRALDRGVPEGVTLCKAAALRERNLGTWQGTPLLELRTLAAGKTVSWRDKPPGGESLQEVARRACGFLAAQPHVPTLVVSHGGTLRAVLAALDGLELEALGTHVPDNAQVLFREVGPDLWAEALRRIG
jgi:broad specificity phosphatase PhoE